MGNGSSVPPLRPPENDMRRNMRINLLMKKIAWLNNRNSFGRDYT